MEKPNLHEILYKVKSGTEDAVLGVKGVADKGNKRKIRREVFCIF